MSAPPPDGTDDLGFALAALEEGRVEPLAMLRLWRGAAPGALAATLVARGMISPADRDRINALLAATVELSGPPPAGGAAPTGPEAAAAASDAETLQVTAPRPATSSAATPAPSAGRWRYTDTSLLGRGGMGTVLRGHDPDLNRTVALKLLRSAELASPDELNRFLLEAQVTGQLEHPNIVPVHELGVTDDGRPFFAMKQVKGRSLQELVREAAAAPEPERGPLCDARWLTRFAKLCDAVAFAHARGVVHRDLKPANVMVGEFGELLVMDWGLAKLLGREDAEAHVAVRTPALIASSDSASLREATDTPLVTIAGGVVGTPPYMAPEQARGEPLGPSADIYALGAVLYELLTLTPPYRGTNPHEMLARVGRAELESPEERAPWPLPRELVAVIGRAMAARPEDRYPDAAALRGDVEAYLEGRTLRAARYTPLQRLRKWAGRHRAVTASVLVALVVAGGTLGEAELRRRRELRLAEGQALESLRRLTTERTGAEDRIAALGRPDAPALLRPNGEPARAAAVAWFDTHEAALDVQERLIRLARTAPGPGARTAIGPASGYRQRHHALCRTMTDKACELGDWSVARVWVARAATAGLPERQRAAWLRDIETRRRDAARRRLDSARALLAQVRGTAGTRVPYEVHLDELMRHRSPALVRLLIDRLRSEHEWERRLAIDGLGRLGDPLTRAEDGRTAVEALGAELAAVDLRREPRIAVAIAWSLGLLRDPAGYRALAAKREAAGRLSTFTVQTQVPMSRIPLPDDLPAETPEALVARAKALADRGRHPEALADIERALARAPRHAAGRRVRATIFEEQGRTADALAELARVIVDHPNGWQAYLLRATLHIRHGDAAAAARDLDRTVALQPDSVAALVLRGNLRFCAGDQDGAMSDLQAACKADPTHAEALTNRGDVQLARGQVDAAVTDYSLAIGLDPRQVKAWFNRAVALQQQGRLALAIRDHDRALELDPRRGESYERRGHLRTLRGDFDGALIDLERAIELAPKRATPYYNRAYLRNRRSGLARTADEAIGLARQALADLDRAIELDPRRAPFLAMRARLLTILGGRPGQALTDANQALALDPEMRAARLVRAELLLAAGRIEEAAADAAHLIERHPEGVDGYDLRSRVHVARGEPADALADLGRAVQLQPSPLRRLRHAELRTQLGQLKEARAELDALIAAHPGLAPPHTLRALVRLALGQLDAALADADRAIGLAPGARGHTARARIHHAAGRAGAALADLDAALKLDPRWTPARAARADLRRFAGRWAGAEADLDVLIEANPRGSLPRLHRAYCRLMQRKIAPAEADALRAAELGHAGYELPYVQGLVHRAAGRLAEAETALAAALRLAPRAWEVQGEYGLTLVQRGRREEGIAALRSAVELAPPASKPALRARIEALGK